MDLLLAAASCLLLYLASPGPGLGWLAWLALVPLFLFCHNAPAKKAFRLGLLCFGCYHLLTLYWVVISMQRYGHLPWFLSLTGLLLLALYMSIYPALFCSIIARIRKTTHLLWLAPLLWVTLEYGRGILFSGFPWMDLGYTQFNSLPIIQCVDLGGHHLLSFLIVQLNVLLFVLFTSRSSPRAELPKLALPLLLICGCLGYGLFRLPDIEMREKQSPTLATTIIQANIDQSVKWLPEEKENAIDRHIELTNQARRNVPAALVIWPETALPIFPTLDPLMPQVLQRTVDSHDYALLSGAPYITGTPHQYDIYNSALLLRHDSGQGRYFKRHLVPFGEYIPLRSVLPLPGPIVNSIHDFSAGTSAAPLSLDTIKIGMLICVEAIYPELARKSTRAGANLLVNITNDAWFGRSSAPRQHLAMTIFRAVENRRSLARAANTGYSAFILPSGRLRQKTGLFIAAHISEQLPIMTSQTIYSRFGWLFPLGCALASGLGILLVWRGNNRQQGE